MFAIWVWIFYDSLFIFQRTRKALVGSLPPSPGPPGLAPTSHRPAPRTYFLVNNKVCEQRDARSRTYRNDGASSHSDFFFARFDFFMNRSLARPSDSAPHEPRLLGAGEPTSAVTRTGLLSLVASRKLVHVTGPVPLAKLTTSQKKCDSVDVVPEGGYPLAALGRVRRGRTAQYGGQLATAGGVGWGGSARGEPAPPPPSLSPPL